MIHLKQILIPFAILISTNFLFSQQIASGTRPKQLEVKALQEDFKQMLKIMELHPARNVFTSENTFEQVITEHY